MKQIVFGFLLLTFSLLHSQAPSWQWAQNGNCTTTDNGSAITTDLNGNVYTTGYFYGSNLTLGTTTLVNAGNYDAFIAKHDNNGNFLWARQIGGPFDEVGNSITSDNSGNTFVCGYYTSNTLSIGTFTINNLGGTDMFIAKYDPNGNVLWAKSFGDNMIEEANAITCDGTNVYATGQFQSNTINFGSSTLTCNGGADVFVLKYDNNGNELWGKNFGDTGLDIGYGINTSPGNDIFVTGSYRSSNISFNTYTLTNNGGSDYFIACYNSAGNEIWAKGEGGNLDDGGTNVLINPNGIYTTGFFRSTNISFGSNTFTNAAFTNADVFLVNYNSGGNELWAQAYGGNFDDVPYGLTTDYAGNIFWGGHIHSTSVVMSTYTLNCAGVGDLFIAKTNIAGTLMWAENIGGLQDEGISGLASDLNGRIFATGFFNSFSVNFGATALNNTGSADLFIAKLNNIPTNINSSPSLSSFASMHPNPTSSDLTITNLLPNTLVKINDLSGKEVVRFQSVNTENAFIDVENLPQGLYLVTLLSDNTNQTLKLSVLR